MGIVTVKLHYLVCDICGTRMSLLHCDKKEILDNPFMRDRKISFKNFRDYWLCQWCLQKLNKKRSKNK